MAEGRGASSPRAGSGGHRPPSRIPVSLACEECKARNYKTTTRGGAEKDKAFELKKFCKQCKRHTLHRETK